MGEGPSVGDSANDGIDSLRIAPPGPPSLLTWVDTYALGLHDSERQELRELRRRYVAVTTILGVAAPMYCSGLNAPLIFRPGTVDP